MGIYFKTITMPEKWGRFSLSFITYMRVMMRQPRRLLQ